MGRGSFAVDYATVVLRKYPDAEAREYINGWAIVKPASEKWFLDDLSDIHSERDEAWRDAAQRILKGNK